MNQTSAADRSQEVAAVDLGSNSFHLVVARVAGTDIQVLDQLRDTVRLAAGLDDAQLLSSEAQTRALESLARFGQRIAGIPRSRVRVVGTNSLRKMKKGREFLREAQRALGHSIEVISGREEARLVYGGVTRSLGGAPARRLVVDIGGGSTEVIIGRGRDPKLLESVSLGCVTQTARWFADGTITDKRFRKARVAARVELEFLEARYRKAGWEIAVGSSGTIRGIWRVMRAQGWAEEEITREGLEKVVGLLIKTGDISKIDYPDLREDRRAVFAGGLAVLAGVFDALDIVSMRTSDQALREGVLDDLIGRLDDKDIRSASVVAMGERYGADSAQAAAVEASALRFLAQVAEAWSLDLKVSRQLLGWAAQLHEIGLAVAHNGYHKHSEYLVRNADLSGFSQTEQRVLAALVRLHRGKFRSATWDELSEEWVEPIQRLAVLLRLAVVMHRARLADFKPRVKLLAQKNGLEVQFSKTWLEEHPLTAADLELETEFLQKAGIKLQVS